MREKICTAIGICGSFLAGLFGGWDKSVTALVLFMAVDYISGSLVALVFHRSQKTQSGSYSSGYGFRGLVKKFMILLMVLLGRQLDLVLGCDYIRNAACIGFLTNELVSILENAGLMGLPIPKAIRAALDLLRKKP